MGSNDDEDRVVRVFVSSTFQDMAAERDELVRRVFPRIRALCETRGVVFCEIDLRWGLTEEQVADGEVLGICLEEIRRCRPYFIGLLGGRYGWIPDEIPDDLLEREPWLLPHRGESSITELEILDGVLNDPEMEHRAFFYLREGVLEQTATEDDRHVARLRALRDRIVASGFPTATYGDANDLGEQVHADLTAMVEARFPADAALDPEAAETKRHDYYAASHAKGYVARPAVMGALDAFAEDTDGPRVLTVRGTSGSGKSALLAAWSLDRRERHPDDLVLTHFAGCSAESTEMVPLLRRLSHELGRWLGTDDEPASRGLIDEQPETDPIAVFRTRLAAAGRHGNVVMVLDGANQLSPDDGAGSLRWLPAPPSGVRYVVSTLPGPVADELHRRGWDARSLEVEPLDASERAEVIDNFLGVERGKHLSTDQVAQIVQIPQTESPLYLRILLDELRVWGQHETLDTQLTRLTAATTIAELLDLVLARYETDLEARRPGLVGDTLRLISVSRQGLLESELLDLLGDGSRLPTAHWATFRAAGSELIVDRGGLLGLAHPHIESAVARRYLAMADQEADTRRRLDAYFDGATSPRAVAERPYQLRQLEDWDELVELLGDHDWFLRHRSQAPLDVAACWNAIHDATLAPRIEPRGADADTATGSGRRRRPPPPVIGSRAAEVYARLDLESWSDVALLELSTLLDGFGAAELAARCLEIVLGRAEPLSVQDLGARQRLAGVHARAGAADRAMEVLQELERRLVAAGTLQNDDPEALWTLASTVGNQGVINRARGDLERAMAQLTLLENMAASTGDDHALAFALHQQAQVFLDAGRSDVAVELLDRAEDAARTCGEPAVLCPILLVRASIEEAGGNTLAGVHLEEAARVAGEAGDLNGVHSALRRRAALAMKEGDATTALNAWDQIASAARASGDAKLQSEALGRQAEIHVANGDLERAMLRLGEADRAGRAFAPGTDPAPQMKNVTWALGMAATIHLRRGDDEAAINAFREQARISEVLDDWETLQFALGSQAKVLQRRGELDRALELLQRVEQLCRDSGQAHGEALALADQAVIRANTGDPHGAIALLRRGIGIAAQAGLDDLGHSMRTLLGEIEAAEPGAGGPV